MYNYRQKKIACVKIKYKNCISRVIEYQEHHTLCETVSRRRCISPRDFPDCLHMVPYRSSESGNFLCVSLSSDFTACTSYWKAIHGARLVNRCWRMSVCSYTIYTRLDLHVDQNVSVNPFSVTRYACYKR